MHRAPPTTQSLAALERGRQAALTPTLAGASLLERAQDKLTVSPEPSQQLLVGILSFSLRPRASKQIPTPPH